MSSANTRTPSDLAARAALLAMSMTTQSSMEKLEATASLGPKRVTPQASTSAAGAPSRRRRSSAREAGGAVIAGSSIAETGIPRILY